MNVKVKKRNGHKVERIQGTGDVKEVFSNADFMHPGEERIHIGFRGEHFSGIIELSRAEARSVSKSITKMTGLGRKIKVIRLRE